MDARRPMMRRLGVMLLALAASGCDDGANQLPQSNAANAVTAAGDSKPIAAPAGDAPGTTPMKDREAVIGLLNKRNGLTRDLTMKPGEALRVGDAIVRLRACETTAPWEEAKETGAFVQLDVRTPKEDKWNRIFSGWLFKERPERNVVEHPIYDVWVKSCAMSWPDAGPDTVKAGTKSVAKAATDSVPGPAANSAASSASETSESADSSND